MTLPVRSKSASGAPSRPYHGHVCFSRSEPIAIRDAKADQQAVFFIHLAESISGSWTALDSPLLVVMLEAILQLLVAIQQHIV